MKSSDLGHGVPSASVAETFELSGGLSELRALANGEPLSKGPSELPVSDIIVMRSLFQPRAESERHVSELKRAILNYGKLDPLTVMVVGGQTILLDGHHRLTAYHEAGYELPVPVDYFTGRLEDALLVPGEANSKAKLPMTQYERCDLGWRFVCLDQHSKSKIAAAAGVSTSQVALMRRVKTKLGSTAYGYSSWMKALKASQGPQVIATDDEIAEWKRVEAQRYADELSAVFQTRYHSQPEIVASALAIFLGRKLPDVVRELLGHLPGEFMADDDYEF